MPIEPSLRLEVQRLDDEAHTLLAALRPFAERVGKIIEAVDRLYDEKGEAIVDQIRDESGFDELLVTCLELKDHAGAAADDTTGSADTPAWYEDLMDRRAHRYDDRKASA